MQPSPTSRSDLLRLLLLLAAAFKLLYLAQYMELPFLYGPLFDSQVYLIQARRVTEGRFGDATLLAFSPLYGYFLALLGAARASVLPVVMQLGLGLLNLVLVHRITKSTLGERAALVAAVFYLGYGPLVFFETKIMSETLGMTLLLLTLWLMSGRAMARGDLRSAIAAGVCMALAVLARASLLPTVPLLALALLRMRDSALPSVHASEATPQRKTAGVSLKRTLGFSLALSLVLGANGVWTQLHSGLFVPVILVSNTAARATTERWTGSLSIFRGEGEQRVGAFSVVEQARARLLRASRGEPEPARLPMDPYGYLSQLPSKLWLTLRDRETSFDYGYYGERSELWLLRLPVVSFGALLCLALVGLYGAARERKLRPLLPLFAIALGTLLTTTLFHPSSRYRLPLLVALLPLAGYAWPYASSLRLGRPRTVALAGLTVVLCAFAVVQAARPLEHPGVWALRVAEAAVEEGNYELARRRIASALALEPANRDVRERADMLVARLPRVVVRP